MSKTPKPKVDQTVRAGPKSRHPGAGWVQFEVSPAVYQHLDSLIHRSGLGEDVNEVAQSLFAIEARKSMKDPARHFAHPDAWYVEPSSPDEGS
jgi:hypothetical protein